MDNQVEEDLVTILMASVLALMIMLEGVDYQCCGYCKNEEICTIRKEYIESGTREKSGTSELAKECGHYDFDGMADPHIWGAGSRK